MEPITQHEYWVEVKALAKSALKECARDAEGARDYLHELVDGHQWVIYTYYAAQVLQHSRNEDAWFEDFDGGEFSSYADAVSKMAYAALLTDTQCEITDILDGEPESEVDDADLYILPQKDDGHS
jgi:hypothetical protein